MNLLKLAQNYNLNLEVIPNFNWLEYPRKFDNFSCDIASSLTGTLFKQCIWTIFLWVEWANFNIHMIFIPAKINMFKFRDEGTRRIFKTFSKLINKIAFVNVMTDSELFFKKIRSKYGDKNSKWYLFKVNNKIVFVMSFLLTLNEFFHCFHDKQCFLCSRYC